MTTAIIVDDQSMIRAGLRGILEHSGIQILGEAANGRDGVRMARALRPDVVLMDLRMPVLDGIAAIRDIRADAELEGISILVLTTFDGDRDVIVALEAGASGFLGKAASPDELVAAVERAASGITTLSATAASAAVRHISASASAPTRTPDPHLVALTKELTPRELDMVAAAATGMDNLTIARALHISPLTVKTHLNRAMAKLGARDRGQLVAIAYKTGIARGA
ncbi:response regulator transcription factor [Paenarthrobacter histidinolovorans]|uniref:response regulator transcription factor n=1 Tax=Paenarthrobacter histidinolovorans TaxID=43664 RepID=UPI001664FB75|nr:response regulator transcription factor [Paenarthrobacter histidinolovorans]GGJ22194.1 DNA-binding response regulator [Paenarthrobacter histidinolovorans]